MRDETDDFELTADDAGADDEVQDDYDDEYEAESEDGAVEPGPRANGQAAAPREDLQRLVHFLATNLVDDPAGVEVEAEQRGQSVSLTLRVPEEELGKVIGRQGRIARAIRTVLTIAGSRQNVRASLDIEG